MNFTSVDCFNTNLSQDSITIEFWRSRDISDTFRNAGITTGSVMLLFFLIGLPSNAMIILSILSQKLYKQPTVLLLLNLALADLMACCLVMPPTIVTGLVGEYIFGGTDQIRCNVCQTGVILMILAMVNLHILALLSLDRFVLIKFPLRYRKLVTVKKAVFAVFGVWILSILISMLPLFGFGAIYYDHPTFTCTAQFDGNTHITKNIYYLILVLVETTLPFSVLIITNIWIVFIAQKQIREVYSIKRNIVGLDKQMEYSQMLKNKLQHKKNKKQLQLLRVFGSILISNLITWIPLLVRIIEASVTNSDNTSLWSNSIVILSINFHSVIHPVIQTSLIPEIRDRLLVFKPLNKCKQRFKTLDKSGCNGCNYSDSNNYCCCKCKATIWSNCVELLNTTVLPQAELKT